MKSEAIPPTSARLRSLLRQGKNEEGFAVARALADAGESDGELMLGWMYHTGLGVERDDQTAQDHYLIGANRGHALSMFYLGWLYATKGEPERAVHWFTLSSKHGCSAATYQLGRMYLAGWGVQRNQNTATQYFETAAKLGHLYARMYIAREMLYGRRGMTRIPVGLFNVLQVVFAFGRTGVKDPDSEFLLRVGGYY
jgi:TPR repeat protein